jgi:hypothetical protein
MVQATGSEKALEPRAETAHPPEWGQIWKTMLRGYQLKSFRVHQIGAQKSTIAKQLIRNDGYDLCYTMVDGMARSAGLWGFNVMSHIAVSVKPVKRRQQSKMEMEVSEEEDNPSERFGGASDGSYSL